MAVAPRVGRGGSCRLPLCPPIVEPERPQGPEMREMAPRARTGFMARRFDGRDAAVKVPLAGVSGRHYVRVTLELGRLVRRVFTQFAEPRTPPARLHIIWSRSKGAAGTLRNF